MSLQDPEASNKGESQGCSRKLQAPPEGGVERDSHHVDSLRRECELGERVSDTASGRVSPGATVQSVTGSFWFRQLTPALP